MSNVKDKAVLLLKKQREEKGPCTNHVDRISGDFDPLPLVDKCSHFANPPIKTM